MTARQGVTRRSLWSAARAPRRWRAAGALERGFTVIEVTVTLAVLAIVFGLTFGLIVGLQQQQVNLRATILGAQQAQQAGVELVSYLRAAGAVNPNGVATGATDNSIVVSAYTGTPAGDTQPQQALITVTYATTGSILPGTGVLDVTFKGTAGHQYSRTIASYYVLSPTNPIFTYYEYNPDGSGGLVKMSTHNGSGVSTACLPYIVAIGINVSFFAGPHDTPTRGYAADVATTLQTEIFLRNVSQIYGSTTTTTVAGGGSTPTCT